MLRDVLLIVVAPVLGCSIGITPSESCASDAQCEAVFGGNSRCSADGFCVAGDAPADTAREDSSADPCPFGPGPEVPYDGLDNDCDPETLDDDLDGDGFDLADDCDDTNDDLHGSGSLELQVTDDEVATVCANRCDAMTDLQGDVVLVAPPADLGGLECIREITGSLELDGTGITSLQGLANLVNIGTDLTLRNEPGLTSPTGLENLQSIGRSLVVEQNVELLSLVPALDTLAGVGADLRVVGNGRLSDEAGLAFAAGLEVPGSVTVEDNGLAANVDNAGFEGTTQGMPDGWTTTPGGSAQAGAAQAGESVPNSSAQIAARNGQRAVWLLGDDGVENDRTVTVTQDRTRGFAVGEEFELTGWAYQPDQAQLSDECRASLRLTAVNGSNAVISTVTSSLVDGNAVTNSWFRVSVRRTIPVDTVAIRAGAGLTFNECGGAVFFDDLTLRKVSL